MNFHLNSHVKILFVIFVFLCDSLKKKVAGKEDETVLACLIPELCFLTGLDDRLRTNFTIMRELAKHTKVAPMQREQALQKYIESVNSNISYLVEKILPT